MEVPAKHSPQIAPLKISVDAGDDNNAVDETAQCNNFTNGHQHSSKNRPASRSATSNSSKSIKSASNNDQKSPNVRSPTTTTPISDTAEKKKLPMNKIQVGFAASPNLKAVKSKIGSLENAAHKAGGGNVKIESRRVDFKNASSRIEAKNEYTPKGGDKKIVQQKLQWSAKSKIGSMENSSYKPKGGEKKIEVQKLDFKERAQSKVGSKDNIKHVPSGGDVKIENRKIEVKVQSKVGSLDNIKHKASGGDKKIFDDKDYLKQMSSASNSLSLASSQNSLPSQNEVLLSKPDKFV